MKDILFYENYTPVADVCTIALCTIHLLLMRSSYAIKQKNLTVLHLANVCVMVAAFSNISYHEIVKVLSEKNMIWVYICRNESYICLMLTYAFFGMYICNLVDMKEQHRRWYNLLLWGEFLFCACFEVLTPVTHLGFWIDSQLQIHQNFYHDIFRYCYVFNLVLILTATFIYRHKFVKRIYYCLYWVVSVSISIVILEDYLMNTSYTCISFAFPIVAALFLFHYNGYDAETGTLDERSFDAYIKNMGTKPFSLLFLKLEQVDVNRRKEAVERFLKFNEQNFQSFCAFRIGNKKHIVVYEDDKNKEMLAKMESFVNGLDEYYNKYQIDYQVVFAHSEDRLKDGSQYLALDDMIEAKMTLNTVYRCKKQDVDRYFELTYIFNELRDIHIRQDIADERVKVYCQPVLNTMTNVFDSAEALMRLELQECGLVYPEQFIPMAERCGYIHTLSKIILNKTCQQIKKIQEEGYQISRISVNFSIIELRDKNFCKDVIEIIKNSGITYDKIAIELTESRSEEDFENVKNIMKNLQSLGVKFYLDDFGTGYSNFERIIGLPIDIIKFDRSLTILAGKDAESRFLVGSFSDIFKKSNYQILFEGVEDEKDENQCKEMNALYLQGYKYSKPIPIEELVRFLNQAV